MAKKLYTLDQIKRAIKDIYEDRASFDSWGIKVMPENVLLSLISNRLIRESVKDRRAKK